MSTGGKRRFTAAERYGVWTAHGERCYVCGRPISLLEMEVDHVVPERLAEDPAAFARTREELGLPKSFDIQSYENWMPSCGPHNRAKGGTPWTRSLLVQQALERARARAAKARQVAEETVAHRQVGVAINRIARAAEQGRLDEAARGAIEAAIAREIAPALDELVAFHAARRDPAVADTPIRLLPHFEVLRADGGTILARGPYGIGATPARRDADASFDCAHCGARGVWNGARCVGCGQLSDD